MGFLNALAPDHEGYPVAYVLRDGVSKDSLLVRELFYPGDNETREDVLLIGAGCECGWRSSHLWPSALDRPKWVPYSVSLGLADDSNIYALWRQHVESAIEGRRLDCAPKA